MNLAYDLMILGGGPAGMTAAIYAAKANLKTLVLEKSVCGGLVNSTYHVENFPSYREISGQELMEKVKNQVENLGVEIREVVEILEVTLDSAAKVIETDEGRFTAPAVILSTGRKPKKLPLDIDCDQIHYCAICDGSAYKGKNVLVVGGGNSGVEESIYLKSLGVNRIILVEQLDRLLASAKAVQQLSCLPEVEILTSTGVRELKLDNKLKAAILYNSEKNEECEKEVDGVFVYMGQEPQTEIFQGIINLDETGYIQASENMETNLPGVFAAGDVIRKKYRQITTAMNDGTIAALMAAEYLRKLKC
ncbi:MAG: FAD-dependent oxidoreductase [Deltaproteobacteria bacterium]|nr:FAD-dependent oxidoreductase [Deltaproteobacteria bacterium]